MDTVIRVQILDEPVSISHSANTVGKGMNLTILPPSMVRIVGQTELFNLGTATGIGEGQFWIKLNQTS